MVHVLAPAAALALLSMAQEKETSQVDSGANWGLVTGAGRMC